MILPGVSGDLLSSEHLATVADEHETGEVDRGWARALVRWWLAVDRTLGPASAPRAVLDVSTRPLLEALGYAVTRVEPQPWGHSGLLLRAGVPVAAFVSTSWRSPPSNVWRAAVRAGVAARVPWILVLNGPALAIVDGTRPWARRTLTFDMPRVVRDARAVAALACLASCDSIGVEGASALANHVAESDRRGARVCAALADGVIDALSELVAAFDRRLVGRSRTADSASHAFEQSLTIVYRLLFLFFAEARYLLPVWHRVYRDAYSVTELCRRVTERPDARGVWPAVQAMARLAHAGWSADDLTVTAFNGRLFAPGRTPLGERRLVSDRSAARAVLALGTTKSRAGPRPVAFHDLGVEQLGAVYENVLDYEPVREGNRLRLRPTSTDRKTSGSFYTPRTMTDFLARRTLGPLVEGRTSAAILDLRVVDPAMGSGAFLVAACRFLTERLELALLAEGIRHDEGHVDEHRAELSRQVAERCLFGVDINPTAVQLARLSLWLTTLAAGRPLTFLDHHLVIGNSLVGARLSSLGRPGAGTRRALAPHPAQRELFDGRALEALARAVVPARLGIASAPSHTIDDVRSKERRLEHLAGLDDLSRWERAADLWCGLALEPTAETRGTYGELQRFVAGIGTSLPERVARDLTSRAIGTSRAARAFHWELAFPEVFLDEGGSPRSDAGFDAVLGNPPWEMLRADTGDLARRRARRDHVRRGLTFVRESGQFPLLSRGHVNQYQLFVSRALDLLRPGGRFGLILPSGLQTDVGSAGLRRALLDTCRLDTWIGFENRRAIFPIHRSVRFLLVGGATGGRTEAVGTRSGLADPSVLTSLPDDARSEDAGSRVWLTRALLTRWDPDHLTLPSLPTRLDAAIVWRALQAPPLGSAPGWSVRFGRELNATDDNAHFVRVEAGRAGPAGLLPIVDGRHLRPFGAALESVTRGIRPAVAARLLDAASTFGRARPCYRDVSSATNRLTLIAAMLPAGTLSTHTLQCARQSLAENDAWCLVGLLNSLMANYLVRLQVNTHVTTALMARLPVPRPGSTSPEHADIAGLARTLSQSRDVEESADAYARLNTVVSRLYGLDRREHAHVVGSFPLLSATLRRQCLEAYEERRLSI